MIRAFTSLLGCGLLLLVCMAVMALMGRRSTKTELADAEVSRLRAELDALRSDASTTERLP